MKINKSALRMATLSLLVSVSTSALATDFRSWDGSESTTWIDGDNWEQGSSPGAGVDAYLDTVAPNPTVVDGSVGTPDTFGRLFLGSSNSSIGKLTIQNGGTLNQTGVATVGFGAGGTGAVMVTGPGSNWNIGIGGLLLIGQYGTGELTVRNGGHVNPGGQLDIALEAGSTGTVNIGAASGDPAAAPGTIGPTRVIFGRGTGTLVFNHTDETGTYEFAPGIEITATDPGLPLINHQAGFTRLTGNSSGLTPGTNIQIQGGTLAVDGMLGGTVVVASGGTLGGSGTANDNVFFNGGSHYLVEMDGTTDPQGLTVGATATLAGTVKLTGDYASITGMGPVTILTNTQPANLVGAFDGVTIAPSIFLTPTLSYDKNGVGDDHVFVSINQTTAFADVANTPNQRATAGGLNSLTPGNRLFNAIALMDSAVTARDAYDQLSGEAHASMNGALVENGQNAVKAVNDRIHNGLNANGYTSNAYGADYSGMTDPQYVPQSDPRHGFWITGYGNWMTTDSTSNTHGFDNDLAGFVTGIDGQIGDYGRLGFLGGYNHTKTSVDALSSKADADSYTIGVYGGAESGNAAFSLGALYSWHSIDTSRTITNPVMETLRADYDARSFQLFGEAGYKAAMEMGTIEPFAGISYINLDTDGFSESGGIAALTAKSETTSTTFTTLGIRGSSEVADMVTLRGMAGWRHAFGDTDPSSTFTVAGSSPFSVTGAPIAEDAAVVEVGVDYVASDNVTIGVSYEGQFGDDATANRFNIRMIAKF